MQLLNPIAPSDLPAEALFSRLRSRRATLCASAPAASGASLPPEQELRALLDWVFLRLDRRLRRQLDPYLGILAMRQLIMQLRYRLVREPVPPAVQRSALLNPALRGRLDATDDPVRLVAVLENSLKDTCPFLAGLTGTYLDQGPGGVEQQLGRGILEYERARAHHPVVLWLVTALIDLRNLLAIAKLWHWQVRQAPRLVTGGRLAGPELLRVWQQQDRRRLNRLAGRVAGRPIDNEQPHGIEKALLDGLARRLRRASRDPLDPALVLDYLWLNQVQAHNRLLRQAERLLPDTVLTEALLA